MPIYEYVCTSCEHEFEAIQKMSDDPLKDCPACNNTSLKKKISAAGFRLSGSGWYETDFKSGGTKKNLTGDDKSQGDGKKGDAKPEKSAKSESKPKTTTETKASSNKSTD